MDTICRYCYRKEDKSESPGISLMISGVYVSEKKNVNPGIKIDIGIESMNLNKNRIDYY